MTNLAHIADRFLNTVLLLDPRKAAVIAGAIGNRIGLDAASVEALARQMPKMERLPGQSGGADYRKTSTGVAIIPVIGTLLTRSSSLDAMSGLVGFDWIKAQVKGACNDPAVTSILFDFHSPGGEAVGAFEAADVIHQVAQRKPTVALVNGMACSAAFALAAACNRIVTTPSGICGSIGVLMIHVDSSVQLQKRGLKPTFLFAGSRKTVGNSLEPLDDEDVTEIQADIDTFYDLFVAGVAAHRPALSEAAVRATEARTYIGAAAVSAGLADQVGSYEDVLAELGRLHGPAIAKPTSHLTETLYGKLTAEHERIAEAHRAGVRAGLAAAMSGKS